jgi:hypothetical protein
MKLIDMVEVVLRENAKALHVDEISILLTEKFPNVPDDLNHLPQKVSSTLAADVKRKGSKFSKPKNSAGGYKRVTGLD